MAIGALRCFAIDVEDLELGASFWSELTGIPRISSPWPDRFAYLGLEDETTWRHEIILHRVTTAKRSDPEAVDVARRIDPAANRAHIRSSREVPAVRGHDRPGTGPRTSVQGRDPRAGGWK